MADRRRAGADGEAAELDGDWIADDGRAPRKEQITIRLDPGMIADARTIGARKGIGHHTLLRMWVMEGIVRAYEDGLLDRPPQNWTPAVRQR
jgi:hypothetical protein